MYNVYTRNIYFSSFIPRLRPRFHTFLSHLAFSTEIPLIFPEKLNTKQGFKVGNILSRVGEGFPR